MGQTSLHVETRIGRIVTACRQRVLGLGLCAGLTLLALAAQAAEVVWFGRAWLEALVVAILIGSAVRTVWAPGATWKVGIDFSAKFLLELAVALLGASMSSALLASAGGALLVGVATVVLLALAFSYGLGRLAGLPHRMATLIACGNSICGNSAIAAVAPVIGAESKDVAASIAFTAVLGVGVVLGLPLVEQAFHLTPRSYGVLAGLTVYAVPQVLAATAPATSISAQMGTLVKLVRVLMLGPIVLALSLVTSRRQGTGGGEGGKPVERPSLGRLVPWFIIGFLVLAGLRSAGLYPTPWLAPTAQIAGSLTILSMAALGLGVDVRSVARAGATVSLVVVGSLLALGGLALTLIRLLVIA